MIGGIIIGDEIMRGKREDKHFRKLIELLAARGLKLDWAQYLGDSPALITETLQRSLATPDIVFCFGGIGATPDDHTRQCAAAAVGVDLALHAEAEAEIRARFGDEATPQRLKMGEFPIGSHIIPNPYNRIPGFSVGDHHFVPGFPVMAWPMVEWVLDHRYAALFHREAEAEAAIIVFDLPESSVTPIMEQVESTYARVKSFSLPSMGEDERGRRVGGRHIELGVRGEPGEVALAIAQMKLAVVAIQGRWQLPVASAAAVPVGDGTKEGAGEGTNEKAPV
jgi:molybdopterin-biosynthesis enzyme MoeA-like protein